MRIVELQILYSVNNGHVHENVNVLINFQLPDEFDTFSQSSQSLLRIQECIEELLTIFKMTNSDHR